MNLLTSLCYPEYKNDVTFTNANNSGATTSGLTSYITEKGKMRMKPPLSMMRMGELYGSKNHELMGFVKSLTYSFPDNTVWETKRGKRVPKIITVAMTYQVVHASVPGIMWDESTGQISTTKFYGYSGDSDITPTGLKSKIQPDVVFNTNNVVN